MKFWKARSHIEEICYWPPSCISSWYGVDLYGVYTNCSFRGIGLCYVVADENVGHTRLPTYLTFFACIFVLSFCLYYIALIFLALIQNEHEILRIISTNKCTFYRPFFGYYFSITFSRNIVIDLVVNIPWIVTILVLLVCSLRACLKIQTILTIG